MITQTLEAQKSRLLAELKDAKAQLDCLRSESRPNFKMLNYYLEIVERNQQLIDMIDCHLFGQAQSHSGRTKSGSS